MRIMSSLLSCRSSGLGDVGSLRRRPFGVCFHGPLALRLHPPLSVRRLQAAQELISSRTAFPASEP